MQTTELLAFDAAPDFVGPPPLRLVEKPAPRSPERQALAEVVATVDALASSITKLQADDHNASVLVEAYRASLDVAEIECAEARRFAAEDTVKMLRSVPRGEVITGFALNVIEAADARPSGACSTTTLGVVEARQVLEATRDMFEASVSAAAIITRQLREAEAEMGKLILVRRDAVWAVVAADPVVQAIRQRHADAGAILAMLQSMHCHPGGPEPEATRPTGAWVGLLVALAEKPDTPLPDLEG